MSIVVTATSGNLGRLVVKDLLNRGVLPPRSSRLHDRPTQSRTSLTLGCALPSSSTTAQALSRPR